MATPLSDFERELRALEVELRRLEADYNQFFAGRLPKLPWDQRARIDALMKRYDRMHIQNTGERFRFQTIQARWATFSELWDRQLNKQEGGRSRHGRGRASASTSGAAPPKAPRVEPRPRVAERAVESPDEKVITVTKVSDPAAQGDRVQALYQQMSEARRLAGEKPVEFDRFAALVKAQVQKLGGTAQGVAFRVMVKDGKVTLSAKAGEDS